MFQISQLFWGSMPPLDSCTFATPKYNPPGNKIQDPPQECMGCHFPNELRLTALDRIFLKLSWRPSGNSCLISAFACRESIDKRSSTMIHGNSRNDVCTHKGLQSVAKLVRHSAHFWNLLDELRTRAKKYAVCTIYPRPPNQCWSLPLALWSFRIWPTLCKGEGGCFTWDWDIRNFAKNWLSVSSVLQPIVGVTFTR